MADDEISSSDENLRCLKCYLPAINVPRWLVSSALPAFAEDYHRGGGYGYGGVEWNG